MIVSGHRWWLLPRLAGVGWYYDFISTNWAFPVAACRKQVKAARPELKPRECRVSINAANIPSIRLALPFDPKRHPAVKQVRPLKSGYRQVEPNKKSSNFLSVKLCRITDDYGKFRITFGPRKLASGSGNRRHMLIKSRYLGLRGLIAGMVLVRCKEYCQRSLTGSGTHCCLNL